MYIETDKTLHNWHFLYLYNMGKVYNRFQSNNNYYWNVLRIFFFPRGAENNIFVYRNNFYPCSIVSYLPTITLRFVNNTTPYWNGRLFHPRPKSISCSRGSPFCTHERPYLLENNVCCPFFFLIFFFLLFSHYPLSPRTQTFTHIYIIILYYVCIPTDFFVFNCCWQHDYCCACACIIFFFLWYKSLFNSICGGANPQSRCNQLAVDQV